MILQPASQDFGNEMTVPNVCPRCHSTALEIGINHARCIVCHWSGMHDELVGVVSDGLDLETKVGKFTKDLLDLMAATSSRRLGEFLVRWGVVEPDDPEAMRVIIAHIVGRMAAGVLQFCMGEGLEEGEGDGEDGGEGRGGESG